ncbi:hypothetical protein [Actinoallomurus iriomotensis]|uniref:Thymidylate kinase n=1 Tax=Actinoallomurus iriomotensis TaxID=478107 RepID=A0A9W6S482_9ACTN|nr:hypothetical protein [Actinoallomurus iriomotensis]GLY87109.1 hypothetical protein Airi02_050380 [Actinoallomurus iriomotensis]
MTSGRSAPSVVLLGIDGAGKTTQAERLVRRLESAGTPAVLYTRSAGVDVERHSMAERVALADAAAGWIARSRQDAADRGAVWVSDRYADCHLAVDAVSRTPDPARFAPGPRRPVPVAPDGDGLTEPRPADRPGTDPAPRP